MHFSRSSLVAFQVWAFALALSEATSPEDFDAHSPVGEEVIPLKWKLRGVWNGRWVSSVLASSFDAEKEQLEVACLPNFIPNYAILLLESCCTPTVTMTAANIREHTSCNSKQTLDLRVCRGPGYRRTYCLNTMALSSYSSIRNPCKTQVLLYCLPTTSNDASVMHQRYITGWEDKPCAVISTSFIASNAVNINADAEILKHRGEKTQKGSHAFCDKEPLINFPVTLSPRQKTQILMEIVLLNSNQRVLSQDPSDIPRWRVRWKLHVVQND
ncbi:hypothetical protein V8E55_001283 [Tylopilus felleus]